MANTRGVLEFFKSFRFTVGQGEREIGVLRVDVGPVADSLRVWRGIALQHQPMFAELFEGQGDNQFQVHLFTRGAGESAKKKGVKRTYTYCYEELVMIPSVHLDAIDSGVALEGVELQGVRLLSIE